LRAWLVDDNPLVVGVIGNLSAFALEALAERLVTIVLLAFTIGSVGLFVSTARAQVWVFGGPSVFLNG